MKRTKTTFSKPSKADLATAAKRLRYMNPEHIANDFPGKKERAAIAAVFKWLSLNAVCARALKHGRYATHWSSIQRRGKWIDDAIVLDRKALDRAEKLLVAESA
jgi:hypothetical protein